MGKRVLLINPRTLEQNMTEIAKFVQEENQRDSEEARPPKKLPSPESKTLRHPTREEFFKMFGRYPIDLCSPSTTHASQEGRPAEPKLSRHPTREEFFKMFGRYPED